MERVPTGQARCNPLKQAQEYLVSCLAILQTPPRTTLDFPFHVRKVNLDEIDLT
jgi:hypothetical protein